MKEYLAIYFYTRISHHACIKCSYKPAIFRKYICQIEFINKYICKQNSIPYIRNNINIWDNDGLRFRA
jgi:hypothetical protein